MFCVEGVFVVADVHMLTAYTLQMFVYQSWFIKVCVSYVFSVVGTLILLSQPRCAAWCYETWPPPPPTTIAAPAAPLSSKPAQNSALRHMWKQFSQCPEQGSPHTHKQTYTHISVIHIYTWKIHTHFTLTPLIYYMQTCTRPAYAHMLLSSVPCWGAHCMAFDSVLTLLWS